MMVLFCAYWVILLTWVILLDWSYFAGLKMVCWLGIDSLDAVDVTSHQTKRRYVNQLDVEEEKTRIEKIF